MNYAAYSGKGRKMPGGEVQKTFKIFCGNLAGAATKDDLYYLFSRYGPVVEAVVMVGKFYGFVHMAYEEDGWKAICELRGYNLHGKTMAVEASINSKKATPLYKQNIIGKGITTLDDFNDYSSSKSKSAEGRERRPPPESFTSFNKPGESSIRPTNPPPPTNYYYHPAFPASASSSQPSPIGHTPPPMSRTSPRPELASLKTMESLQGRESPLLKMQAVDANSNPIQEHNTERLEGVSPCCNLCGSVFDEWQHKPKILSCGHTFCCNCLLCLAQDVEVKCPSGCPYTTALTDAGISGLTTNYTVPIKKLVNTSISPSLSGISSGFVLQNGAQSMTRQQLEATPEPVRMKISRSDDVRLPHSLFFLRALSDEAVQELLDEVTLDIKGDVTHGTITYCTMMSPSWVQRKEAPQTSSSTRL